MSHDVHVEPVTRELFVEAVGLFCSRRPQSEQARRQEHLLKLLRNGSINTADFLVARRLPDPRVRGVMLAECMPGRVGSVIPPTIVPDENPDIADALVREVVQSLRLRGMAFAQSLVPLADASQTPPLVRNGFTHVTTLLQMLTYGHLMVPVAPMAAPVLKFQPYSAIDPGLFTRVLLGTYIDSEDVPESGRGRGEDDILAGLRDGQPDPQDWWLATDAAGAPAAVLLVNTVGTPTGREVTYLGVLPEVRRRGVGQAVLRFLFQQAIADGIDQLQLSVDMRNRSAVQLYRKAGFQVYHKQEVFLWHPEEHAANPAMMRPHGESLA